MNRSRPVVSALFGCALAIGCAKNTGDDAEASTTSTSATTGHASGSVTSAPGSATANDGTAGSSATTMATATGATGEGCSFQSCEDMMFWCDTFTQDCPEGQKCTYYMYDDGGFEGAKCVDVTGTDKPGDECTVTDPINGIDSCVEGAICWGVVDGVGTCIAMCRGSYEAPVCDPPIACTSGRLLTLCIPSCDPLLQDCPHPGEACYPIDQGFFCAPNDSGDAGQANDPCEFINSCDEGLMCADATYVGMGCAPGSSGCCTPFCPFPGGPCPNPDQQCTQWFDPMQLPANDPWLGIGVCIVPV